MTEHVLNILGTKYFSLDSKREEYQQMIVSDEILNFLQTVADIRRGDNLETVFVINNMKLSYVGMREAKPMEEFKKEKNES